MDFTQIGSLLVALIIFAVLVYVFAIVVERLTEVTKATSRGLASGPFKGLPVLNSIGVTGVGSFLLSLVYAALLAFNFHVDLFSQFAAFQNLDPQLVAALTTVVVWIYSNFLHNGGSLPTPLGTGKK